MDGSLSTSSLRIAVSSGDVRQVRLTQMLAAVIDCDVTDFRQPHDLAPFPLRLTCMQRMHRPALSSRRHRRPQSSDEGRRHHHGRSHAQPTHQPTSRPRGAGGPSAATASRWSCRAAARSAPTRPASTRRCTRRASSRTGSPASRSARSTRRSSPATSRRSGWSAADFLGAHHQPQDLALHARRRRLPQGAQPHSSWMTTALGQPGFFTPHRSTRGSARPAPRPRRAITTRRR